MSDPYTLPQTQPALDMYLCGLGFPNIHSWIGLGLGMLDLMGHEPAITVYQPLTGPPRSLT